MEAKKEVGIFQQKNGVWGYRLTVMENGKRKDIRRITDEEGNQLTTKKDAIQARAVAIYKKTNRPIRKPIIKKTVAEVFQEYRKNGCYGKAYTTLLKQDSLWNNHIKSRFGNYYIDELSSSLINDYLAEMYFKEGYSFRYVEGFLKIFWIVVNRAYARDYINSELYTKLCVNKTSKISMPKLKTDEDMDIVAFDKEELELLDSYFEGTNAETGYLLGRYCGLRINETYGLKWDNVDLVHGTITIDRQQQYQNGLIKLVPVKTRCGKRTIYLCNKVWNHLSQKWEQRQRDEIELLAVRQQKARKIEDINGKQILATELVNCLSDGTLQTRNSFKYPSREIKKKLKINFKYHYLRHTYGTMMAELNTPEHLLCSQMGHSSSRTTQKYYIAVRKSGIDILRNNINQL